MKLYADLPPAGHDVDPDEKGPRSFHVRKATVERARAAIHWLSQAGVDVPSTLSELVDSKMLEAVEQLERDFNEGNPFPTVSGRMRSGPGAEGKARISEFHARRREEKQKGTGDEGG